MSLTETNLLVAIFFLAALVAVRTLRRQLKIAGKGVYTRVAGGLFVLALAALTRVFQGLGYFAPVPFLSHNLFFDLFYWIVMLSGCTLILAGMSGWLPQSRTQAAYSRSRVRRLELLKRMEQLVAVESRWPVVLEKTLTYLEEHLPLDGGAVYLLNRDTGRFGLLSKLKAPVRKRESISLPDEVLSLDDLKARQTRRGTILEIHDGNENVALYVLSVSRGSVLNDEDRLVLRLVGHVLERKSGLARVFEEQEVLLKERALHAQLTSIVRQETSARAAAATMLKALSQRFKSEYSALCLVDDHASTMLRFSLGPQGRILVENEVAKPAGDGLLRSILKAEHATAERIAPLKVQPRGEELLAQEPVTSLLASSYPDGHGHRLVVVLGSSSGSTFTQTDCRLLTGAESAMGGLSARLMFELFRERVQQQSAGLAEFLANSRGVSSLQEAFEQAGGLIFRQGSGSLVRISVPDRTGRFLESRVLLSSETISPAVPEDGQMIISLMARHQECLKRGQTILASPDNSDNRLIGIEIQQALAEGVEQALIVPVMVGRRAWALITVGFERSVDGRELTENQTLAETAAAVLGLVIPLCVMRRRSSVPGHRPSLGAGSDQELQARLRSSLTGILGSVEILRSREDSSGRTADNRYLEIIDRSARRIDALIQPEEPVSAD